jgi:hypothetical protein
MNTTVFGTNSADTNRVKQLVPCNLLHQPNITIFTDAVTDTDAND